MHPDSESGFMLNILTCGSQNWAGFCHPSLDRRMEEATRVQLTYPLAAHGMWSSIEHDVVDLAPWVPLVNSLSRTLVSKRVGNFQLSPQWGPLVDQDVGALTVTPYPFPRPGSSKAAEVQERSSNCNGDPT